MITLSTKYICPICGGALEKQTTEQNSILLFCPWGRCSSRVSNDGAIGETEEDAMIAFLTLVRDALAVDNQKREE